MCGYFIVRLSGYLRNDPASPNVCLAYIRRTNGLSGEAEACRTAGRVLEDSESCLQERITEDRVWDVGCLRDRVQCRGAGCGCEFSIAPKKEEVVINVRGKRQSLTCAVQIRTLE